MIYSYQLHLTKILGAISLLKLCLADVLVYEENGNETMDIFADLPAIFGPTLPAHGFKGYIIYVSPPDACIPPAPPPKVINQRPYIALIRRFNCSFVQKVLNVQRAGYGAAIVRNVGSNSIEVMSKDPNTTESVTIPSVFVGQDDGLFMQEKYQYKSGYFIVITDELPFNIQNYLLPFAITIGICFLLMLIFMLVKCIRDYRRSRRHRLSSRALKKLPVHKFKKGDPYECCAICLEDYADNDKLRILPCSHAYHTKCIDPWLTKNRRVCPVCKRKVIIGDEQPSDYDSDSDDETAPLINSEGGTHGGTFSEQRENPFREAEREVARRRHEAGHEARRRPEARSHASFYHQLSDSDESSQSEDESNSHPTHHQDEVPGIHEEDTSDDGDSEEGSHKVNRAEEGEEISYESPRAMGNGPPHAESGDRNRPHPESGDRNDCHV